MCFDNANDWGRRRVKKLRKGIDKQQKLYYNLITVKEREAIIMRELIYEVCTKTLEKYETSSYEIAKEIQEANPGSEIKAKLVKVKGL